MGASRTGSLTLFALAFVASYAFSGPTEGRQPPSAVEYRVLVSGEVRYPGRVTLTESTMSVADALAAVGSPTADAGEDVVVIRSMNPEGRPARVVISLKDIELGTKGIDVSLREGDIVNVPIASRFSISGFVARPGAYKLQRGTTVSEAIALAGGLATGGSDRRIKITRILNGKSNNITVRPGDNVLPNDAIQIPRTMF